MSPPFDLPSKPQRGTASSAVFRLYHIALIFSRFMTLTTAAILARLRSTPQKYKLFLTLIQINRFFYRKTSLPHQPSSLSLPPSFILTYQLLTINCYLLSINLPISQPSAFSLRSFLFHLTSYILHRSALSPQPSITSSLIHQPSFFPLTSYFIKHISHQPSHINHLSSSLLHLPSYFIKHISLQPSHITHLP